MGRMNDGKMMREMRGVRGGAGMQSRTLRRQMHGSEHYIVSHIPPFLDLSDPVSSQIIRMNINIKGKIISFFLQTEPQTDTGGWRRKDAAQDSSCCIICIHEIFILT